MKRIVAAISAIVLFSAIGLTACSTAPKGSATTTTAPASAAAETTAPAPADTPSAAATGNTAATTPAGQKQFTLDELKKYDGQNGNPAYVAVNGTVYDVTNARGWNNGKHQSGVTAGQDLTKMIGQSPHGTSVLAELPVVGTLK